MNTNLFLSLCLFLSLSMSINAKTYSSVDCKGVPLDYKLRKIMNYKHGFFVEVGGHDGVTQSNTKLFETFYKWHGILIEPSPKLYNVLCKNRPNSICYQCALGSFEEEGTYVYGDFDGSTMSSINGERLNRPADQKVFVRSLQSLLDELNMTHVDFLSLDTEGYEWNILKGIDFEKTQFNYILIEIYNHQYDLIVDFLCEKGYELFLSITNYNLQDNPQWDGTHNDYLFKRIDSLNHHNGKSSAD